MVVPLFIAFSDILNFARQLLHATVIPFVFLFELMVLNLSVFCVGVSVFCFSDVVHPSKINIEKVMVRMRVRAFFMIFLFYDTLIIANLNIKSEKKVKIFKFQYV